MITFYSIDRVKNKLTGSIAAVPEVERIRTSWPVLGYVMSSGSSRTAYNIP